MAKVKLREGQRSFDSEDSNFLLYGEEEAELETKHFRSYSIKHALFNGHLRLTEGEILINIKHASVLFSAEHPEFCYAIEHNNFFKKDMKMDTIVWLDKDLLPLGHFEKLTGPDRNKPIRKENRELPDEIPLTEKEDIKKDEVEGVEETEEFDLSKFKTKKELDKWAEETHNIKLDRRQSREEMEKEFQEAYKE